MARTINGDDRTRQVILPGTERRPLDQAGADVSAAAPRTRSADRAKSVIGQSTRGYASSRASEVDRSQKAYACSCMIAAVSPVVFFNASRVVEAVGISAGLCFAGGAVRLPRRSGRLNNGSDGCRRVAAGCRRASAHLDATQMDMDTTRHLDLPK